MKTIDDVIKAIEESNELTRILIEKNMFKDALVLVGSTLNMCALAKNELNKADIHNEKL